MTRSVDFDPLAPRYDELRGGEGALWRELVELLVEAGDLRGRRVLDVGCGTGRLAAALAERYAAKVWGVDPSPGMLEVARGRVPRGVGLKLARAEELPFTDGWFERVTMTLVYHHVDPARALPEIRRVLSPRGRLALLTFDAEQIRGYYLNRYFPSLLEVDLARFRPEEELRSQLAEHEFHDLRVVHHRQRRTLSRDEALTRIRGKHISTFQLIPDEEYEAGLARAERELPERIEYDDRWLVVVARGEPTVPPAMPPPLAQAT
ncbi:MAG: methyltransferase domain-containing protein [Thermoleophilia bacterium]|nr:methyltransferase domain-containing protein [Thermoleophilia bacterium]